MKSFCSAPRIIMMYITVLCTVVIMIDAYYFGQETPGDQNTAQILKIQKQGIEEYGFIVPCPAGTYAIIPWSSSGIPLGNPGLKGGLLFFDRDTIYFGEGKNK